MDLSSALTDFDTSEFDDYDKERVAKALESHRELYLNHLSIARWIDRWIAQLNEGAVTLHPNPGHQDHDHPTPDDLHAEEEGPEYATQALRRMAAHLRQADFVPGGRLHREAE